MYEPFPGNYVWNLGVNICVGMGGAIGEMDRANDEVRAALAGAEAGAGDIGVEDIADRGTEAFFESWGRMGDQLVELGEACEAAGHTLSAAEKYMRAVAYYVTAERMQSRHYEPRRTMYATLLETMDRAIATGAINCERVEIPYEGTSFPGLFIRGAWRGSTALHGVLQRPRQREGDDLPDSSRRVRAARHIGTRDRPSGRR